MIKLSEFRPTQLDAAGLFRKDKHNWLVCDISVNRDSNVLAQANWKALSKILAKFNGDYEVLRFGHWACGWFEIVVIKPDSKCQEEVEKIEKAISDYPVICDITYSQMESEEISSIWSGLSISERINLCNKCKISIFSSRGNSVPYEVYGEIREKWL